MAPMELLFHKYTDMMTCLSTQNIKKHNIIVHDLNAKYMINVHSRLLDGGNLVQ